MEKALMQMFLKMIDLMRDQGYVVTLPMQTKTPDGEYLWIEEKPRLLEWELFARCQPFVFTPQEPFDNSEEARASRMSWEDGYDQNESLDAPFPVFSIEYFDGAPLDFFLMANGERRETVAVIVVEIEPKQYGYYALTRDGGNPREEYKVFKSNMEGSTVERIVQRLSREKLGMESVRTTVKLGEGKTKRLHRIRRVIHVAPKKYISKNPESHRQVNWTHRFEVRGHWVSLPGRLGKDREGNYCVSNWTWRSNYVKGDESLPLVKKTRVVD